MNTVLFLGHVPNEADRQELRHLAHRFFPGYHAIFPWQLTKEDHYELPDNAVDGKWVIVECEHSRRDLVSHHVILTCQKAGNLIYHRSEFDRPNPRKRSAIARAIESMNSMLAPWMTNPMKTSPQRG